MTKKSKRKKKAPKKKEKELPPLELCLEGAIYIVDKDEDGNEISKEELDSTMCLKALDYVICQAVEQFLKKE